MKPLLVSRRELDHACAERDEWRKRAEVGPGPRTEYVVFRTPRWTRLVTASWLVILGLLVGGLAIPRANDRPILGEDYPACIGQARYQDPIEGNQYQELVNALYACGIYRAGGTDS
jgi:hypothetical protein